MQRVSLFALLALLLGCIDANAVETTVFVDDFSCTSGRFGLRLPTDIQTLKKRSKVLRVDVDEVEQWEGYTATRKTLYFIGLELGVVELSNEPSRFLVTYAVITSPYWNDLSPFKLRRPTVEAASIFGKFARSDPGLLQVYGSEVDSIRIESTRGVVSRVLYECYSG